MPSELERSLAAWRKRILERDQAAAVRIMAAFGDALGRLQPMIALLDYEIEHMPSPTPAKLFRLERYQILERQLIDEITALAQQTGSSVRGGEAQAIEWGQQAALELVHAAAAEPHEISGSFARVPADAIRDLVGTLSPESPAGKILESFGTDAAAALREAITSGAALGQSPRVVARAMQKTVGMKATRALLISRTEMLRAFRTSTLARYSANADVLQGWKWVSAHNTRTCAACLAMDQTVFPLSTQFFPAHPACRCAASPVLKPEYAVKRTPPESGDQWLSRQSADVQDGILGRQGGAAYRAGEVALGDFVRVDDHPIWGESHRDGGIAWARAKAAKRTGNTITRMSTDPYSDAIASLPDRNAAKSGADYQERTRLAAESWEKLPDGRTLGERYTYTGKITVTEKSLLRDAVEWYTRPHGDRGYHVIRARLEQMSAGMRPIPQGSNEAWAMARAIHLSPPIDTPLYRGSFSRSKAKPDRLGAVGDTIRLPGTASFTVDKKVADAFREGTEIGGADHDPKLPNHETTIVVLPGAKGFRVDSFSIWDQAEVISSGEFEIVDVDVKAGKRKNGKAYEHVTYTVRQTSYWQPPEDPPGRF